MEIEKLKEDLELATKVSSIQEKQLIATRELVKATEKKYRDEIKKLETTHEDELNDLQEENGQLEKQYDILVKFVEENVEDAVVCECDKWGLFFDWGSSYCPECDKEKYEDYVCDKCEEIEKGEKLCKEIVEAIVEDAMK